MAKFDVISLEKSVFFNILALNEFFIAKTYFYSKFLWQICQQIYKMCVFIAYCSAKNIFIIKI